MKLAAERAIETIRLRGAPAAALSLATDEHDGGLALARDDAGVVWIAEGTEPPDE